jgi:hypothetical protein
MNPAPLVLTGEQVEQLTKFLTKLSKMTPPKPDYWNSCHQCEAVIDEAQEFLPILTAPRTEALGLSKEEWLALRVICADDKTRLWIAIRSIASGLVDKK